MASSLSVPNNNGPVWFVLVLGIVIIWPLIMVSNKTSLQNQFQNSCARSLEESNEVFDAWLENSYYSITVANQHLVTVIRFVLKSYTHLWRDFANRFYLARYACTRIPVLGFLARTGTKRGHLPCDLSAALRLLNELRRKFMFWDQTRTYCAIIMVNMDRKFESRPAPQSPSPFHKLLNAFQAPSQFTNL